MKHGAADYLLKDRLTRLGPAVRQALHEKHMRDAKQRAETALRDSEARFRAIAAATPIPMVILQASDSTILYANAQFGVTFGLSVAQATGRQMVDYLDNAAAYHTCVEALADDGLLQQEICLRRSDGSSFWAVVSLQRLRFDGRPALICGFYDMTIRKQTEAALARQARALAHTNMELEQFLYIASHDLQEPLRKITSFVQLLAQRYEEKLDADARTFIAYAVEGAQRMRQMLHGLLAYSRLTTRGTAFAPTDCEQVLGEALSRLHTALRESGAEVTHDALPVVKGEAAPLVEVFQHLLDNALKFRGQRPPRVHVGVQRTDDAWVFSVCDNGIGIAPQYAERIFVVFKRLHSQAAYPGAGIGLALCKKIIERHSGRIWVESQLDQGATFFFTLPYAAADYQNCPGRQVDTPCAAEKHQSPAACRRHNSGNSTPAA
jgi:PAS domain S-box-containing protein